MSLVTSFRIMCDVPNIAVFCSESIECFPGTASKFFLKLLVTIPVAPIFIGIIVHFRFHILCTSIHKLLYFSFFSASFCTTFLSAGIVTSISVHVFSFLFLIIISGLFAVTSPSVCTAWLLLLFYQVCAWYGTNRVSSVRNVAAILWLQSTAHITRKAKDTILQHTNLYYSHHKDLHFSAV